MRHANEPAAEIRTAKMSDIPFITSIFNQAIETTTATFYTEARSHEQMLEWLSSHESRFPVLVAEVRGEVVGWASLSPWSDRQAYSETSETSYYVLEKFRGKGIGRALVEEIIIRARQFGFHTIIARTAEGSQASISLIRKLGFQQSGVLRQVGCKFGRRLDVYVYQKFLRDESLALGDAHSAVASGHGQEPIGFLCGDFVRQSDIAISYLDLGMTQGIAVSERLRTFNGRVHLLKEHLHRFSQGLATVGIEIDASMNRLAEIIGVVVRQNYQLVQPPVDLGVAVFATPGSSNLAGATTRTTRPTLCVTTDTLPLSHWASTYQSGLALITSRYREIPDTCIPRHIKHRNRLHYWLAEREAKELDGAARALMLDVQENVAEGTTARVIAFWESEGLVAPPENALLPSVTAAFVERLAAEIGINTVRRPLQLAEIYQADEVLWCSTPMCLFPVTRVDQRPISTARPGPMFQRLAELWAAEVGVNFVSQAEQARDDR